MKFNISNKLKIVLISISTVIALAVVTFVAIKLFTPRNNDLKNTPKTDNILPQIFAETNQTVEILDTHKILEFSIENLGDNEIKIINNNPNILEIDENYILSPLSLGTTEIVIIVNTPSPITKTIYVDVVDCTKNVEFNITDLNDNPISKFYTNADYLLTIIEDYPASTLPSILSSIEDFTLISYDNSKYVFKFKVTESGSFSFVYKNKYFEKSVDYIAIKMPDQFEVIFSNSIIENELILYLIDKNYQGEAILDNIFDSTSFTVATDDSTFDDIEILLSDDKNVVILQNDKITANNAGQATIIFKSKISGISKSYVINVYEVQISKLLVNKNEVELNSSLDIPLKTDETVEFEFSKIPVYSNLDINILFDENEFIYKDNILKFLGNQNTVLYLTANGDILCTINIEYITVNDPNDGNNDDPADLSDTPIEPSNPEPDEPSEGNRISHIIQINEVYLCEASLNENTLTVYPTSFPSYVSLDIIAKFNDEIIASQLYDLDFDNQTVCDNADNITTTQVINIEIKSSGSCTLKIYDKVNDISIEIIIVVL